MEKQVISKRRVQEYGEVLTGQREVNAMLDLVKPQTEHIESRFLEPACGNGNFLAAILERKLAVVEKRYKKSQLEFERNAVLAVSSLYGIDILAENVSQCRERLFEVFDRVYERLFPKSSKARCRDAVQFILDRNIIWGNALDLKTCHEPRTPIIFSEWSPVNGSMLKRRDFTFEELLACGAEDGQMSMFKEPKQLSLFSDLGKDVFIPRPVNDFSPVHFMELAHAHR